jgi:hypothetical protein
MKASLVLLTLALVLPACGEPVIQAPAPLEVAFMPLDGAVNVVTSLVPQVVFSGAVDEASLGAESVLLATARPDAETGCADVSWQATPSSAALGSGQPHVLEVRPAAAGGVLAPDTCYRLTLTTAVRGVDLGPLLDLGLPERPGVGAEAIFQTAP